MINSATRIALTAALFAAAAPAVANPFIIEAEQPAFTTKVAVRYWYGMGSTSKDLYGLTRDTLNSRLSFCWPRKRPPNLWSRKSTIGAR